MCCAVPIRFSLGRRAYRCLFVASMLTSCSSTDAIDSSALSPTTTPAPNTPAGGSTDSQTKRSPSPSADTSENEFPDGCQPLLAAKDCTLPYPSDFFRRQVGETYRIMLDGAAEVRTSAGVSAGATDLRSFDGFSWSPTIVALLQGPVSNSGFVTINDDYAKTMSASSQSVIVEATEGHELSFVPHFIDLDPRARDPERQAIEIRPATVLKPNTRYVVALQGLKTTDGSTALPAEGFRRIRDKDVVIGSSLAKLADHYDMRVFPVLERAGIDKASLQLAWDFTTASESAVVGDMIAVRDQTLTWLDANRGHIRYQIDSREPSLEPRSQICLTIRGKITGPRVVTDDSVDAKLHYGPTGVVSQNGDVTFDFVALVPKSVCNGKSPGQALGFGHGFFWSREEVVSPGLDDQKQWVRDGATVQIAHETESVVFGIDWVGMSVADYDALPSRLLSSPAKALAFVERVPQAMANWLVTIELIKGQLAHDPAFLKDSGPNRGENLYDPTHVNFLGISQGHILGGVLAALSPDLSRVVLHVGGSGWTHLAIRSRKFEQFIKALDLLMVDPLDVIKAVALMASPFDRIDAESFARFLRGDISSPLLERPVAQRILLQSVMGDTEVPTHGSYRHALALGIAQRTTRQNSLRAFGLTPSDTDVSGSALTVFDMGVPASIYDRATPIEKSNGLHGSLRRQARVIEQMHTFFKTGLVVDPCEVKSCGPKVDP